MTHPNELFSNIAFDDRRSSYASFFDHAWAVEFDTLSDKSRIQRAAFVLMRDWKGIALSTRMPWLMIESLQSFHGGFTKANPPYTKRLASLFARYVTDRSRLSNMKKKELLEVVNGLDEQVRKDMEQLGSGFDPDAFWQEYLGISEFCVALWNGQRIAYGAIYYAYENFLQRVVAAGRQDESYRAKNLSQLREGLEAFFGASSSQQWIDAPKIEIARLVRNSLTHDGGRVSDLLRPKAHGIRVVDDELQIFPEDTRYLFNLLKAQATNVAETAATNSAFSV